MGNYLNPGNEKFGEALNSAIYNEIRAEYVNAVSASQWGEVSKALKNYGEKFYLLVSITTSAQKSIAVLSKSGQNKKGAAL